MSCKIKSVSLKLHCGFPQKTRYLQLSDFDLIKGKIPHPTQEVNRHENLQ